MQVTNVLWASGAFLFLFSLAEWLYHTCGVRVEWTRKLVHFMTGIMTLGFPFLFISHWIVLGICVVFLSILYVTDSLDFLNSIHGVERKTAGAHLFPAVVYGSFLSYAIHGQLMFFYLPIAILSVCDPVAALVGKRFPWGRFLIKGQEKTVAGSLAFAVTAVTITTLMLAVSSDYLLAENLLLVLSIGVGATLSEALVVNGYDNISIPLTSSIILLIFHNPIINLA